MPFKLAILIVMLSGCANPPCQPNYMVISDKSLADLVIIFDRFKWSGIVYLGPPFKCEAGWCQAYTYGCKP